MPLSKKILISLILIFPGGICLAQAKEIDSLHRVLPSLRDTARIDCLNELSRRYEKGNKDSASYYADLAHQESSRITYTHGIAVALFRKAEIQSEKDDNYPAELDYSLQSIAWYRKTPDKKGIAAAYLNLGLVFYKQSYYAEAIKNLDTAYQWYEKNNDGDGLILALIMASNVYQESGNYEKYFDLNKKSLEIATKYNSYEFRDHQIANVGSFFEDVGDYKKALEYYRLAFSSSKPRKEGGSKSIDEILVLGHIFSLQHQFDSAKYYLSLADTSVLRTLRFYLISMGEYYFAQGKYSDALPYYIRGLAYHQQITDRNQVMNSLIEIANIYVALGRIDSAFKYITEGKHLAEQTHAKPKMRDAYQILSSIYDKRHQPDSAFYYFKKYTLIKDSVLNDKVKGQLNVFESEQQIALLTKEKQIQEAQLQKQTLLRNILIAGILIFFLLAAIIFRVILLKRRNDAHRRLLAENELHIQQLESKRQFSELEMQALRAQMNPHFIFNSLNSINRFILQNNRLQASEYLTKFSKLVRMILQNSQSSFITLENELESLGLYLEMETLRFNYHFTYNVSVPKDLDIEMLKVPPLILQPYVENAIWHGLMHKEEKGQLDIAISQNDDHLCFIITDNGIGRKKSSELASKSATKHKSMGLRITAQRIAMMQAANGLESPVEILDLVAPDGEAAGTEVIIKMPVLYD